MKETSKSSCYKFLISNKNFVMFKKESIIHLILNSLKSQLQSRFDNTAYGVLPLFNNYQRFTPTNLFRRFFWGGFLYIIKFNVNATYLQLKIKNQTL